jgi:hypothetical protein
MNRQIAKLLSANDTGETGTHQAGILIPKEPSLLSFFPTLDPKERNPRAHINFLDESGTFWQFAFIYYNNAFFNGTRNEYRLTRMTKYIRQACLVAGDEIILSRDHDRFYVANRRHLNKKTSDGTLKLGSTWRIISI